MEEEAAQKCVVKHRTRRHPAPNVPKPKREAQGSENHAFRLGGARSCVPGLGGTRGGSDPPEGQRSGWIVCRRSHYHAGLWLTPSNEYLLKFYGIPLISIEIL